MKRQMLVWLLIPLAGCGMYYSRVGGTAHDKLYRGTLEEVGKAAEAALLRHGYVTSGPQAAGTTVSITGQTTTRGSVTVYVMPAREGLVEARVGSEMDWRQAIEIHRWIAVELGVLYRREP